MAWVLVWAGVLLSAASAKAQPARPITATAQVGSQRVYVGEPVLLTIDVANTDHADAPPIPTSPEYSISLSGEGNTSQTFIVTINGKQEDRSSRSYRFQYSLTINRAGRVTIPALVVSVGGKPYRTEPLELDVVEPAVATGSKLTLTPVKTSMYVGEPVLVTMVWYLSSDAHDPSITIGMPDSFEMLTPSTWQPSTARPNPGEKLVEVIVNSERTVGIVGKGPLDGESRTTLTLRRILIPSALGEFELPPARVSFQVATGRRRSTLLDSPFDDLNNYERRVVMSEPITLSVKPLPLPAPVGFTGLVGNYTIDVAASPTVLNVGEPLTLSIRVGGPEPLDRVPPMDLSERDGFAGGFKLPSEPSLPNILPTAAIFSIDVRPASDRVRQVPPIEIPYFDTTRGEYVVARSSAIPLIVQPTVEVTLDDDGAQAGANAITQGTSKQDGVDTNGPPRIDREVDGPAWAGRLLSQGLATPTGAAAAMIPIGVYGLAVLVGVQRERRERDPSGLRRRLALRRAAKRLRRISDRDRPEAAVSEALRGLAADYAGVNESGMTTRDADRVFAAHFPAVRENASRILVACDRAMFSPARFEAGQPHGAGVAATSLIGDAAKVLAAVKRSAGQSSFRSQP